MQRPIVRRWTERAPAASIIHLSCHGRFNAEDALASSVLLADGEFTARDWMRLRLNADLVTLSACQLGISEQNPGDDLVGMARALMYAGASSLLLTLWSVRADTTKDWMLDFYKRVWKTPSAGKSQNEAYAVRDAMLALRDSQPRSLCVGAVCVNRGLALIIHEEESDGRHLVR